MTLLTVNYSAPLVDLLAAGQAAIDGIEVGSWFTLQQIAGFRQALPALPFYYHAGSLATNLQTRRIGFSLLHQYLTVTGSPWLSFHIELLPLYIYVLGSRFGIHLPPPHPRRTIQQFLELFDLVSNAAGVPLLLENLMSLPPAKYRYAADPELITVIIERTGAGFLLDLAHARVAACYQEMDVQAYLEKLPLEKVEQVHLSGARTKDGQLYDAHEPMEDEDYRLLEWVLGRCRPKLVTLEYFRVKEALREQLARLSEILDDAQDRLSASR